MITLLVFKQFDEDTSVMHVSFLGFVKPMLGLFFVNCSEYRMRFVHYLSLFWLGQACVKITSCFTCIPISVLFVIHRNGNE